MRVDVVAVIAIATFAANDRAVADTRTLIAADGFVATDQGEVVAADAAWSAHLDWKTRRRELTFDFVERESLIGSPPRRELHELAYVEHLRAPISITVGRFRIPGGFWLIADGGALAIRRGALELATYGGARSFSNARDELVLRDDPELLPLVGASITRRGEVQARVAYTYTRDRIVLPGDTPTVPVQPEQFLDAELLGQIGDRVALTAGATLGTRYLIATPSSAARSRVDPRLETVWFGSQAAYSMIDVRVGSWRLGTAVAALRTKSDHRSDAPVAAAITGSFVEWSSRARWRRERTWRADLRYRARAFADRRRAHRVQAALAWQHGVLVADVHGGIDVHAGAAARSGYVDSTRAFYRASVGYKSADTELSLGIAAVATIADELAASPGVDPADTHSPYTFEGNSYGFARAFATRGRWFAGSELEIDRDGDVRLLVQLGWGR